MKTILSNPVIKRQEAGEKALEFEPRSIHQPRNQTAVELVKFNGAGGDSRFRIDPVVSEHSGVAAIEYESIEEKVEKGTLERLRSVQEKAYAEGHKIGRDEGYEAAYQELKVDILKRLESFDSAQRELAQLKVKLVEYNESHFIGLIYQICKRLTLRELASDRQIVVDLIHQAVLSAQEEEDVVVRLSEADFQAIRDLTGRFGKELEVLNTVKFESSPEIAQGGCRVETNFGEVDARTETRLARLWDALVEKRPVVTGKTSDES
jgi:flagellar assembly protein FliH